MADKPEDPKKPKPKVKVLFTETEHKGDIPSDPKDLPRAPTPIIPKGDKDA